MWGDLIRDLPQGLPGPRDRGLDFTHTWGRTYWGGALFCLLADVEIHQRTHNQKGLEDALRGILAAGSNITENWPLERTLRVGDEATGTRVLENLYKEMKDKRVIVNLASLWGKLGIQRSQNGGISFTDDAPLASVRKSITRVQVRRECPRGREESRCSSGPLPSHQNRYHAGNVQLFRAERVLYAIEQVYARIRCRICTSVFGIPRMLIKKQAAVPFSEITPKDLYLSRRKFLAGAAVVGAAAAAGIDLHAGAFSSVVAQANAKIDDIQKSKFSASQAITPYKDVTNYNNYYEFSTDKYGPAGLAKDFKTRPWTVNIEGLLKKKRLSARI